MITDKLSSIMDSESLCKKNKHRLIPDYNTCLSCIYEESGKQGLVFYIRDNLANERCDNTYCTVINGVGYYRDKYNNNKICPLCSYKNNYHPGLSNSGNELVNKIINDVGKFTINDNTIINKYCISKGINGVKSIELIEKHIDNSIIHTQDRANKKMNKQNYQLELITDNEDYASKYWASKLTSDRLIMMEILARFNAFDAKYKAIATDIILNPYKSIAGLLDGDISVLSAYVLTFDMQTNTLVNINHEQIILDDIYIKICCIPVKFSNKFKVNAFIGQLKKKLNAICNLKDFRFDIELADLYTYKRYDIYGYNSKYYIRKIIIYSELNKRFGFISYPVLTNK